MINQSYKKLIVWQKAIELAKKAYELTKIFPKEEVYGLTSQIRRSAVSVPANIAEGSQRKTDKDFGKFILIAKGSLVELETFFILSHSFSYISNDLFEDLMNSINELDKMLYFFCKRLIKNVTS